MKIFHTGDVHYSPKYWTEADRCFGFAVEHAITTKCDVAVLAGDTFDHAVDLHHPCVAAVLAQVRKLADAMPVLILQGTRSHDAPGSLEVFKTIGGKYPVAVCDTIGQVLLDQAKDTGLCRWEKSEAWTLAQVQATPTNANVHYVALFSCLPSVNKGAIMGAEQAMVVGDLLAGWAPINRIARALDIPTIVVSHGTVGGCVTEQGAVMAGLDHEFSTGSLFCAEASAVMLAHIHQMQVWERDGRMIGYPGSPGRLHFGETTDKGFFVWDVQADGATVEFVKTPAKTLLQIDYAGIPDIQELAEIATRASGAHVRVRWSVDEDHRNSVDQNAIRALFAHAEDIKLEGRVNPVQRSRAAGIGKALTIGDKLSRWCAVTTTALDGLHERLEVLVATEPEQITAEL